jgi:predicted RNA-binding Zn-ribbon protein involved in translation (DUF1610 family)
MNEKQERKMKMIIDINRIMEAIEADNFAGFCLACGVEASNVEADAREFQCEDCGEEQVYGAEICLMMKDK